MNQFQEFISNHLLLVGAFVALLVVLILNEIRMRVFGIPRLSSDMFVQKMNHEDNVVVDLRSQADFKKGHILGAINIPHTQLEANMSKIDNHRDKTVLLVCNMGQQSLHAGAMLRKQGYSNVSCLAGGMMSWRSDNLPLTSQ